MGDSIKVGVIADQTGPLSRMGCAQANVSTLVVNEINASGGVLGRRLELILEWEPRRAAPEGASAEMSDAEP